MFNTITGCVLKEDNGIQVFGDFNAVLGWTPTEGNIFKIAIDGWSYKDFTVSGENFSGTELLYNEGLWGWTFGCCTATSATTDTAGIEYTIPSNYANENLRCAIYLTSDGTSPNTWVQMGTRVYNTQTRQYGDYFPFASVKMDNSINMYSIGLPYSSTPGYVQTLNSSVANIIGRCNTIRSSAPNTFVGIYYNLTNITCNVPIFDTKAHAEAYLADVSNETIEGILNYTEPDPESDFINDQKYYKLKNLYARGSGSSWTPVKNVNYRIKPVGGKICLYKHKPTESAPYEWKLYNYSGYTIYSSRGVNYNDDDDFISINNPETEFLQHSIKLNNTSWRVNIFDTDIPRWNTKQDADDYINGLKDISECLNYDYIVRTNQEILGPDIGQADPGNDNGSNGMVYSYGSRMYVMSSSHLAGFFSDVFNTANINDILDGTKLFGSNQIGAITGIMYFPCDIDEFCTVVNSGTTPHVGSWVCPTATSNGYITKNDKMIDCGGAQLNPIYNDFRDLEPYNLLWVTLPFCGTHQLQLTKYLGKFISFKYSIDAVTGVCTCHIYADGVELDSFDGVCASSRPITAIDQTQYLSNVIGAVNSGMNAGTGAISSGAQAIAGAMSGNVAGMVGGVAGFGASGAEGVFSAYNVMQAVDNPPMTTRGSASGCQGFFGPTRIHLHFFQKKSVKPLRSLELCGAPSNTSGTVSQFSGFLKCRTVKIADGFTGTHEELNDIMQYLKNGIYV